MKRGQWPDLSRTAAALERYDREQIECDRMLENANTQADYDAWMRADAASVKRLSLALYADTMDRNKWADVAIVHPNTIREWVAAWRKQTQARAA